MHTNVSHPGQHYSMVQANQAGLANYRTVFASESLYYVRPCYATLARPRYYVSRHATPGWSVHSAASMYATSWYLYHHIFQGVEARGTEISGKSMAMRNLDRAIGNDLTYMPNMTLLPRRLHVTYASDHQDGFYNASDDNITDSACPWTRIGIKIL